MKPYPPLLARVVFRITGHWGFRLWLPLFLLWPLVAIFGICLLPLFLLYACFVEKGLRKAAQFTAATYGLLCSLHGLNVDFGNSKNEISVRFQ